MPGSKPGERRGGRQKGALNKSTLALLAAQEQALKDAAALIPADTIDAMTPAEFLNAAWKALAKINQLAQAVTIAKEAAPYYNTKLAPTVAPTAAQRRLETMTDDELAAFARTVGTEGEEGGAGGTGEPAAGA